LVLINIHFKVFKVSYLLQKLRKTDGEELFLFYCAMFHLRSVNKFLDKSVSLNLPLRFVVIPHGTIFNILFLLNTTS